MRKSEAAASSSSVSDANIKHTGSGSSIPDRGTTATIKNNATTTTTTTTATTSSVSGGGGGRRGINGTPAGNGSNDKNNSVQSAGREQHPLLDRQFDVVTAPLATFDTVDLSDEDEVTPTSDTTTAPTTTTGTTTKSPSFTGNNAICRESNPTGTPPLTTSAAVSGAVGSHGIKTTRTITDAISCSNSINASASSSLTPATSNTNSTTISTLLQKLSPIVSVGKKSDAASSSTTLNPTPNQKKNQKKNSESSRGSNGASSPPQPQEHKDATTSSAERTGKNLSPLHHHQQHPNDGSIRINQSLLPGDGVKDTDAISDPTRATDPRVVHPSSSDDEENASSRDVLPDASSASLKNLKLDAISVESTLSSIREGSSAKKAAAADTTAIDGATAGIAPSSGVTHEFANFSSCDDLNSNNIGGNQSTVSEGGGLPTPAASVNSVPKPKELTAAVEKANLLDESSSSDSDLSPTEPANSGGAYTTLASGSTPNLLRKIGREPTGKIKESSAQTTDFNSPEVIPTSSKRKAYERRLQRLQVKTTPINRPRSATPLSVVTLDEYTNLSSPEISPNLEKLKIVLPADQFGRPIKSPRSKENAFDFNEDRLFRHTKEAIVLQSDGSIGQSPRRIFIPPTLSPSQSPCKAAAGSPVSKLVLVSRLPAGTSPLVKSAAPTGVPPLPAPPPPLTSPPPPPNPTTTTATATTFSFPSSTSSSASTWLKGSDKQWEQFDESRPQGTKPPPQTTCSIPKRSEPTAAIPDTFDKKTVPPRLGPPPPPHGETGCPLAKGHREHEKRKTKVSTTVEEPTKPTLDQHHADSRRNNTSALHPSHKMLRSNPEEEEEEQILKVEIGSSDVGKAYNIELEVPTRERSDSSYSKSSS